MAEEKEEKREVSIAGLPLKSIEYVADVRGFEAQVTVEQKFGNELGRSIEAIYVFPLPAEAKVLGVEMTIGDRTVKAELRKREDAKRTYEEARDAGHHAALVEQERENIFTVSVGGIEPGESVSVRSRYMMPVPFQNGGGRFSLPLVVAPRFIPGVAKEGGGALVPDADRITPKLADAVTYTASVELRLSPGFPAHVESPSHDTLFAAFDCTMAESRVLKADGLRPDRDVIFTYTTTVKFPSLSVDHTIFEKDGTREDFALLQVTPGATGRDVRPRRVMFLLDHSGSMSGPKIEGLKVIVKKALGRLVESGGSVEVGIMMFDHGVQVLVPLSAISATHTKAIDDIPHGGNTNLGTAVTAALQSFKKVKDADAECCVILVCDGQSEDRAFAQVPGVRVHTIGIDSAVNDELLKEIARKTDGVFESVIPGEDYDGVASRMVELASGPVVRDLKIDDLPDGTDVVGLGDLYAARPRTITVRLPKFIARFKVKGRDVSGTKHEWTIDVPQDATSPMGALLWAKMKMRETHDREEQTRLSLRYGIVSSGTAFVAVSEKVVPGEKPVRVDIPVLLPHTWEYDDTFAGVAIGASVCRRMVGIPVMAVHVAEVNLLERTQSVSRLTGAFGSGPPLRGAGPTLGARLGSNDPSLLAKVGGAIAGGVGLVAGGIVVGAIAAKDAVVNAFGGGDGDQDADGPEELTGAEALENAPLPPDLLDHYGFMPAIPPVVPQVLPPPPLRVSFELLSIAMTFFGILRHSQSNSFDCRGAWEKIMNELAIEDQRGFAGWDEVDRAKLFYYLVRLRDYGYKVTIPAVLEIEPKDPVAHIRWVGARHSLGKSDSPRP